MIPNRCNTGTPGFILAHTQIIGFPWIDRCSPFTAQTPDCLHKMFLPLSSWNVFTGNNNSKIIAMKWTGTENELTKLAMNGIPTPCELNWSLIAQSLCRKGWTRASSVALHFCACSHLLLSPQTSIAQLSILPGLPQALCQPLVGSACLLQLFPQHRVHLAEAGTPGRSKTSDTERPLGTFSLSREPPYTPTTETHAL